MLLVIALLWVDSDEHVYGICLRGITCTSKVIKFIFLIKKLWIYSTSFLKFFFPIIALIFFRFFSNPFKWKTCDKIAEEKNEIALNLISFSDSIRWIVQDLRKTNRECGCVLIFYFFFLQNIDYIIKIYVIYNSCQL